MAKITRYNGNLQAFASGAIGTERTLFGEVTQADDLTSQITADFLRGWGIIGANDFPTKQDFNAQGYTLSQLLAYLHQAGIPEWNTAQEYFLGSMTITANGIYRSLVASNIGNDPETDSGLNWGQAGITTAKTHAALRTITPTDGVRVYRVAHTSSDDQGGLLFRGVTGAAPGTYVENGGTIAVPAGGDGSAAWLAEFSGNPNAAMFGAVGDYNGTTGTDNTTAIQAAIDYVLESDLHEELEINAGRFLYSTLNLYDSASANTRAKKGKITLIGHGSLEISDLYGQSFDHYGTELVGSRTTGSDIVVSLADPAVRKVAIKNLTLVSKTNGLAIEATRCPEFTLENVGIRVTNAAGGGAKIIDCWFSRIHRSRIIADVGLASTGVGIEFTASLFAGLHEITGGSSVDGFRDCYFVSSGANFTSILWEGSAVQKFNRYGWRIESPIWNFTIRDCYTESLSTATSALYINAVTGLVRNLIIDGLFILGGSTTVGWFSGPAIDITNVDTYQINNVQYFRPWSALLSVTKSGAAAVGTLNNINVYHDNIGALPAGPLYMLAGDVQFSVSAATITATSKLALFNPATYRNTALDSSGITAHSLSHGKLKITTTSANTYDMANDTPVPMDALITAGGAGAGAVRLPRANTVRDTDTRHIINDPASTQSIDIKNGALAGVIATLTAGQAAVCIADATSDKWIIIIGTAAYGT